MKKWLIIDGYNLIYQLPRGLPLLPEDMAGKRQFLLQMLDEMAGELAERVTVVFDGAQGAASERIANSEAAPESSLVEIRFSPADKTADTVIEQLVCGAEHPEDIAVVTSDRPESDNITAAGAEVISSAMFLGQLASARQRLGESIARRAKRAPGFSLGDQFPEIR